MKHKPVSPQKEIPSSVAGLDKHTHPIKHEPTVPRRQVRSAVQGDKFGQPSAQVLQESGAKDEHFNSEHLVPGANKPLRRN